MTPAELRSIGEHLYGKDWKNQLALELPVSIRSIRYWLAEDRTMRSVIANRIRALAAEVGKP